MISELVYNYKGLANLRWIKNPNQGMRRYQLEIKELDFSAIIPAYNREDAIFRARHRCPKARFARPPIRNSKD